MVEANQLRIGNIILAVHVGLKSEHLRATGEIIVDGRLINDADFVPYTVDATDLVAVQKEPWMYRPMPLTADILEGTDFEKTEADEALARKDEVMEYWQKDPADLACRPVVIGNDSRGDFFYRGNHRTLNYVHELQNLYFALTGEELVINL
jgi:hypothetical protein